MTFKLAFVPAQVANEFGGRAGIRSTDPFPPADSVASYKRPAHLRRADNRPEWQTEDTNRRRLAQLFLESLRPDFMFAPPPARHAALEQLMGAHGHGHAPAAHRGEAEHGEPAGAAGGPSDQRPGHPGVLGLMRNFLNSLNFVPV